MKAIIILVLALCAATAFATECHPLCKWQCDDPTCPAVCHPVCARPKCEMKCEETPCAKCVIHCERPVCSIRCPKEQCEKAGCPQCETVCQPARCHTTCTAPPPKCAPVCEQLDCTNKCIKPTNCAKPKCELQCERPACETPPACCACSALNIQTAVLQANTACACNVNVQPLPVCCTQTLLPSFIEVMHTMMHKEKSGAEQCCPCNH